MNEQTPIGRTLLLPNFAITDIYAKSLSVKYLLMPIGATFDYVKGLATGRVNERDDDTYSSFYITAAELVNKERLPQKSLHRLMADPALNQGDIYLGTFIARDTDGTLWERQGFMNERIMNQIGILMPTENEPTGDKKSILVAQEIDWTTHGQYWGYSRPRIQRVSTKEADVDIVTKINDLLSNPYTPIKRSPLPVFWSPLSATAKAALSVAGFAASYQTLNLM